MPTENWLSSIDVNRFEENYFKRQSYIADSYSTTIITIVSRVFDRVFFLNIFVYICGFSFVAWRCFFFALLSYTSTPVSRFRFIDLYPSAVYVTVAYFFDTYVTDSWKRVICYPLGSSCKAWCCCIFIIDNHNSRAILRRAESICIAWLGFK